MATKPKERTLYYRRVTWLDGVDDNLEKHLVSAHDALSTTNKRTFTYGDGEIQGLASRKIKGGGIAFHVAEYVPHQPASLVPIPSRQSRTGQTLEHPPPRKNNYLSGDIFCLLRNNDLMLCPSGLREQVAESYIKFMLISAGLSVLTAQFEFNAVASVDRINYIKRHGVKKIELSSSLYEATVKYEERKGVRESLMKDISDSFLSLFKNSDSELGDLTAKENLQVKLVISFDSRKSGEVAQERLMQTASQIVQNDHEDGFKIITGDNQAFTADQIRMFEKYKIQAHGNSVNCQSAWDTLEEYYAKLKSSGVLQQ